MSLSPGDVAVVVASGRATRAAAVDSVRDFLEALGARDLARAATHLGPGFRMTVSGSHHFESLEDFVAFGRTRHAGAVKRTEQIDACETPGGFAVYAFGMMSGRWLDGSEFTGVRYIDRFLVRDGRIVEMQVWSDMGEFRPR